MAKIGDIIELDEAEQRICKFVAKERFTRNRKNGVANSKVGGQSNELTDLEGFAAEVAFCKLFNSYPDFSINPRSSKSEQDKAGDTKVGDIVVDVKTTTYKNGKLLAVSWKDKGEGVDVFALMIGTFPKYTFRGVMAKDELLNNKRIGNLGHGDTYIAQQSELIELDS